MAQARLYDLKIATSVGNVRGELATSVYNETFYSFQGVPYAKRVLPTRRYKSPEPIDFTFLRTIDCSREAYQCVQFHEPNEVVGTDDCLYLNIYTKELYSRNKLPVMVYIHGGGFNVGSALRRHLGPDYFMMKDVVLITVGFRLGLLGFLSFKDAMVRAGGNAGIKDIVLALKFIKTNAAAFNGDPKNITLFGHGSGSAIVQLLMQTNQCKGLFHKAILMAGFYLDTINIPDIERRLAGRFGQPGKTDEQLHYYLSHLTPVSLVSERTLTTEERNRGYRYGYLPNVETYVSPTTIISVEPVDKLATAWGNDIPVIIGHTSAEGLARDSLRENIDLIKEHPEYLLPLVMQTRLDDEMKARMVDKMLRIHLPDPPEICRNNISKILEMQAHSLVCHPLHRFLNARRQYGSAPTYLYRFDVASDQMNPTRRDHDDGTVTGIGHGEEVKYLFYMDAYRSIVPYSKEATTMNCMIDMWTEFAKRSDPNVELGQRIKWEPVAKEGVPKCLNIWENLGMIDYPEYEKNLEWDKCFQEAGLKLF